MRVKLEDVCERGSSNLKQSDIIDKIGEYPIYGATGYLGNVDFYHQEKPYVAVVKDGAGIGRTTLHPAKSSVIGTMQYLLPKENVLVEYLCYVVRYMHLEKYFTGATIPHIYFKDYKSEEFNLDTLDRQREIVDILKRVENIIEFRQKELQKLDDLIKARFVELFGDCLSNPKGWKTKCLEDIAEVGSSKRVFVEELRENGIPFYRGTEVGALAEGKQITPELFITEQHYAELCKATGTPRIGDLLMPSICPDGRIWLVNTDKPFYFKDGRVLWVHAIDTSYNPVFLLYTLKDRIMTDYSSIASGTTFAELKIFALKKCQVFDVPITLQNEFAAFIKQIDKSKAAVQAALDKTQLLFDSLMQEYFG
ncbi:restriction endonuclease subunit S [Anaerotignum sp.]